MADVFCIHYVTIAISSFFNLIECCDKQMFITIKKKNIIKESRILFHSLIQVILQNIAIGIHHFSQIFLWLGCNCNNQGSTKTDGSNCTSKCCDDDGSCQCKSGYAGESCNKCLPGYHVSAIANSEVTCDGLYTLFIFQ